MNCANTDLLQELRKGIVTTSAAGTEQIAGAFAALVPENQVLALHGDLGAGKTNNFAFFIVHQVECFCDSEVGQFYIPFLSDHDIFRIYIPVHDS